MSASESTGERGLASLSGRTVLVTGAGKRVGRAIALALGHAGANVAVHVGRSLEEGRSVVRELQALGVDADVFAANQREVVEVEACCDAALERFGSIDGLVNSAAIWPQGDLEALTQEDFDQAIEVNLRGPFFFARKLGLAMREHGGAIVNIADVSTDRPWVDSLPYCAAKAGVVSMTFGMAKALAPRVRVNAIGPGPILFPPDYPAERVAEDRAATLRGQEGHPEDIAQAALYLLSAVNVTGVLLPVDGGYRFGI